jgi:hypothetical protein
MLQITVCSCEYNQGSYNCGGEDWRYYNDSSGNYYQGYDSGYHTGYDQQYNPYQPAEASVNINGNVNGYCTDNYGGHNNCAYAGQNCEGYVWEGVS